MSSFAERLANAVAAGLDQCHRIRATGKETFVPLPREIPVRLLYHTVLFSVDCEPVIRSNLYGWNESIATALRFAAGSSHHLRANGSNVGPCWISHKDRRQPITIRRICRPCPDPRY